MTLLAVQNSWIADVVFIALLLLGVLLGTGRGFVRGICKLGGSFLALVVAFFFCVPFGGFLGGLGLQDWLVGLVKNATAAYWITVVVSFLLLTILTKLVAFLLGKIGRALVARSRVLNFIDRILGALLGFAKAFLLACIVLAVFYFIKVPAVIGYIEAGKIVGPAFGWVSGLLAGLL